MKFVVECPYGSSQCQVTLIYRQPVTKISRSEICRQLLALFWSKVDVNSLPVLVNLAVKPFPVHFIAWTLSHTNRLSQYVGCRDTERSFAVLKGRVSSSGWAGIRTFVPLLVFLSWDFCTLCYNIYCFPLLSKILRIVSRLQTELFCCNRFNWQSCFVLKLE